MRTHSSWRRRLTSAVLALGLLCCHPWSGKGVAESKRILLDASPSVEGRDKYPTVFHYVYARGQQFLNEQQQTLRTVPRLIRKVCFVPTAAGRQEEAQERLLAQVIKQLRQLEEEQRAMRGMKSRAELRDAVELYKEALKLEAADKDKDDRKK